MAFPNPFGIFLFFVWLCGLFCDLGLFKWSAVLKVLSVLASCSFCFFSNPAPSSKYWTWASILSLPHNLPNSLPSFSVLIPSQPVLILPHQLPFDLLKSLLFHLHQNIHYPWSHPLPHHYPVYVVWIPIKAWDYSHHIVQQKNPSRLHFPNLQQQTQPQPQQQTKPQPQPQLCSKACCQMTLATFYRFCPLWTPLPSPLSCSCFYQGRE